MIFMNLKDMSKKDLEKYLKLANMLENYNTNNCSSNNNEFWNPDFLLSESTEPMPDMTEYDAESDPYLDDGLTDRERILLDEIYNFPNGRDGSFGGSATRRDENGDIVKD